MMNDLSESLLLPESKDTEENNETNVMSSSTTRLNSNLLTPLSQRMKDSGACFTYVAAFATSVPFLAFSTVFMVSAERVYFKVMTDNMSRYRYVLAQFMILCNLILSTVVVLMQKMYRECTCDCDDDSDDDEEEKPRYLPHFNFSVFDIIILGVLETISYFGVMIPSATVPAIMTVTLVQYVVTTRCILQTNWNYEHSNFHRYEVPFEMFCNLLQERFSNNKHPEDPRRKIPLHRPIGMGILFLALMSQLLPYIGAESERAKIQIFSSVLFLLGVLCTVLSRRWQRHMLTKNPIDHWGLSCSKLFVQFCVGAALAIPLVRLQWTGSNQEFWPSYHDEINQNLRHGIKCIFGRDGDKVDMSPENVTMAYNCDTALGFALGYPALDAIKSLVAVFLIRQTFSKSYVYLYSIVGSLIAFLIMLPWPGLRDKMDSSMWPIASEPLVPEPIVRRIFIMIMSPLLLFTGMLFMFIPDLKLYRRSNVDKNTGKRWKTPWDLLPLTTEAAFRQ